jgi:hypothetical protein
MFFYFYPRKEIKDAYMSSIKTGALFNWLVPLSIKKDGLLQKIHGKLAWASNALPFIARLCQLMMLSALRSRP